MSGCERDGLIVVHGTIVDSSPGGLRIALAHDADIDPGFVADVIVSRSIGEVRHLVMRALAIEGRTLRASFLDPATVDPAEWQADPAEPAV